MFSFKLEREHLSHGELGVPHSGCLNQRRSKRLNGKVPDSQIQHKAESITPCPEWASMDRGPVSKNGFKLLRSIS